MKFPYRYNTTNELNYNTDGKISIEKVKENVMNKRDIPEETIDSYIEIIKENTDYYESSKGYLYKLRVIY